MKNLNHKHCSTEHLQKADKVRFSEETYQEMLLPRKGLQGKRHAGNRA